MPAPPELVLVGSNSPSEDELALPRPPGVIRRFWARHPLLTDILIAVLALLLTLPSVTLRSATDAPIALWSLILTGILSVLGCVALVWRRRWPLAVFVIAFLSSIVVTPDVNGTVSGPAALIALYSVAVYRGSRACWTALGLGSAALALSCGALIWIDPSSAIAQINVTVATIVVLLIAALAGVNVGNRRRYLLALIDRSRQLLIERDQQARLAAAEERTRIAREMHDIVSHSLTVVVALAEGATATRDPVRSAEATRAIADTARGALAEMRDMLGVLREESPLVPLGPTGAASVHDIIEAARAAGAPVTLSTSGTPDAPAAVRLAVLRVVREGLTNAIRYARDPSYIRVVLDYRAGTVEVTVENDGAPADAPSEGAGLGLQGLQERADHVGGTMEAGMIRAGVWRLWASLPTEGTPGD